MPIPGSRSGRSRRSPRWFTLLVASALALLFPPAAGVSAGELRGDVHADSVASSRVEFLPLLSYDTDVGFGYGLKLFVLSLFGQSESFDLVLFHSTGGERWYRLAFAFPDFERRHGRPFPLSVDVLIDYDKYLKDSFFGIGNASRFDDRERYTREPLECSVIASRGWTNEVVTSAGLRYRWIRNHGFQPLSRLAMLSPAENRGSVSTAGIVLAGRIDARDSYVNPSRGTVLSVEGEIVPRGIVSDIAMSRWSASAQWYAPLIGRRTVLAARIMASAVSGDSLPVQLLSPVGGTQTLRGSPHNRFLDRASGIANVELRFPLVWRLGGVAGFDAGNVWSDLSQWNLKRWSWNGVAGLRLYMDMFLVRLDAGIGRETTGFYLNFGQLF